jgi:hypothetical protein
MWLFCIVRSLKSVLNRFICDLPIFSFGDYAAHYSEVDSNYVPINKTYSGGFTQDKRNQHKDYTAIAHDMDKAWQKLKQKHSINE